MNGDDAILAELTAQRGEISQLRASVAELQLHVRELRDAQNPDARLLHAVHDAMGDRVFIAAEVFQRALHPDDIGRRLASLVSNGSVRSLGRRFAQISKRRAINGLSIFSLGASRDGTVWRITQSKLTHVIVAPATACQHGPVFSSTSIK